MPRQTEPNANNALGDMLRGMMPGCDIRSENTQTFIDHPGRHADVLIVAPGRSPVGVEAEYEPAIEVEKDASERLGLRVKGAPRTVETAIALRYPKTVKDAYDLRLALVETRLTYCVLRQDGSRFPESGWLDGSVSDLADIVRLVSVPHGAVEQAADTLEQGIGQAATRLDEMAKLRPNVAPVIARLLGMSDVPQTRRMACAIVANAMVFHQRIAGMHQEVKTPSLGVRSQCCKPPKRDADGLGRHSEDQLLAHICHRQRHLGAASRRRCHWHLARVVGNCPGSGGHRC